MSETYALENPTDGHQTHSEAIQAILQVKILVERSSETRLRHALLRVFVPHRNAPEDGSTCGTSELTPTGIALTRAVIASPAVGRIRARTRSQGTDDGKEDLLGQFL